MIKTGSLLPELTNRWLEVNETETKANTIEGKNYHYKTSMDPLMEISGMENIGISQELLESNRNSHNYSKNWTIYHGDLLKEELILNDDNNLLVDHHYISGPEGHCGILILEVTAKTDAPLERNSLIHVDVKEDSFIQLILIHRLNEKTIHNISVVANVADGGALHLTNIELGDGLTNFHYHCDLKGYEARTSAYSSYIQGKEGKLDLYYFIRHLEAFTESNIQVHGALLDSAKKSFRGTLDFPKGCIGSVGNEEEFSILMSSKAKSIAVPLLLATENNIEGNHAASAGQMDEDLLFYLMSRGFDRKEAEGMVIEAKMAASLDRIPDDDLRKALKEEIHERIVSR